MASAHVFSPCRAAARAGNIEGHGECRRAYIDEQTGEAVKCACLCHFQGELLKEFTPQSKQGSLF